MQNFSLSQGQENVANKNGIRQMRSEEMGWGEIAQEYSVKLGTLMSRINSGKQTGATTATTTTIVGYGKDCAG